MALRLLLTDKIFDRLESVLLEIKPKVGSPPQQSDRMFIEAVLYVARTGIPWRDLPQSRKADNFSVDVYDFGCV